MVCKLGIIPLIVMVLNFVVAGVLAIVLKRSRPVVPAGEETWKMLQDSS